MRIRRRKHLEERLESVKDYFIVADKQIIDVNKAVKDKKYFNFTEIFGNENPVIIDIGCGKGGFVTELALKNPDLNFIGVEMMENIALLAAELAKSKKITNLKFVNSGAEYLPRYFPPQSVSRIYLNFSPPYPKKSNENRRLTNSRFAAIYHEMLISAGEIIQKTDDKDFFDYSYFSFVVNGFETVILTDEKATEKCFGIISEYEKKFINLNAPVYALAAIKK